MIKSVKGILNEEIDRLAVAEKSYQEALSKLPKGSIQKKQIKGGEYPYLIFRKGRQIASRYLGNLSVGELKKLEDDIRLRRKYSALLRDVKQNKKQILKMVHGKRKAI